MSLDWRHVDFDEASLGFCNILIFKCWTRHQSPYHLAWFMPIGFVFGVFTLIDNKKIAVHVKSFELYWTVAMKMLKYFANQWRKAFGMEEARSTQKNGKGTHENFPFFPLNASDSSTVAVLRHAKFSFIAKHAASFFFIESWWINLKWRLFVFENNCFVILRSN